MLDHLHQKAAQAFAAVDSVILSSYGPADIQSGRVACAADDLTLYLFIPRSSDHLINLETRPGIVVATEAWELYGTASLLSSNEMPVTIKPAEHAGASVVSKAWGGVAKVQPTRLTFHSHTGLGNTETIDF
jgi:hypothetical protein